MNVYAIFPLFATIAYIPLLVTIISSRPWQKRHTLFILYLVPAVLWSFLDYLFRSHLMPWANPFFIKAIIIVSPVMAIQLHCFTSSFFAPRYGRWLPFAYISLAIMITLVLLGYIPESISIYNGQILPVYGIWIIAIMGPSAILVARNFYVYGRMLRRLDNPVLYNQIIAIIISLGVLLLFSLIGIFPLMRDYPLSHFANLINAGVLSYAVIRHHLVDIKIVIRKGLAWFGLLIIGTVTFWLLLVVSHILFDFELDPVASLVATIVSVIVSIFVYRLRGYFFELMNRAVQGSSYQYRQKLSDFTNTIHNIFSLKEQGGELLVLLTKAVGIKQACLLFPESGSEDFHTQIMESNGADNKLDDLVIKADNPIIKYLKREQKPLSRENMSILPIFLGLWSQERDEIEAKEIEMFLPLISRDRLIAILVLGQKTSGKSRYSLEDYNLLDDVTSRVSVSMEKEYLREQLREREEELSVLNRCSAIISSSLDIQEIFGSFIEELKKVIDISWASIVVIQEEDLCCIALSSPQDAEYQVGDKLPLVGTGTGWVINHGKAFIESDITKENHFNTGDHFSQHGLRSMVYLPLISKGETVGSFIVASRQPNAYTHRNMRLLEQLAAQISIPLENAQLYAKAEEMARVDALTGLLNRRSLDEMIDDEINRHLRYGGVFSLAILDLDSFKAYNDSYGHLEGDRLLRQVGTIIKQTIRTADRAFRYGGDEFAILLPQTDVDAALQVTERVREKIASDIESGAIQVTASIGLASWPDDGVSHTDIIAAADVTLYRAKRIGGNQSYYTIGSLSPLQAIDFSNDGEEVIDNKTLGIIHGLSDTIDSRNRYTHNHSKKVAEYALQIGKHLKLKPIDMSRLETCALLLDIGKIGINESILNKKGPLTDAEWELVKAHPQLGANMASRIPQLAACADGIRYHHEWYNGKGYPDGLAGDEIPLSSRILAIADAFTAMTSERSYAKTFATEEALEQIEQGMGKQFDPQLAEIFIYIQGKSPAATRNDTRR